MGKESTPRKASSPSPVLARRATRIVARAPLPIIEVQGTTHTIAYVNSAFCHLVGKTRGELLGHCLADIVPGDDECVPTLDRIYRAGEAVTLAKEDGLATIPAHWLYAMWPPLNPKERPVGVIIQLGNPPGFHQNATAINEALLIAGLHQHELKQVAEKLNEQLQQEIAERKLAEQGRNEYSSKLEVLSRRLVEAQETERRHLARELHDEIGQSLTSVQLTLQAMAQISVAKSLEQRVKESLMVVGRVLEQVQDISLNLRPSILDDLGLEPALHWLTNRQAALAGLSASVQVDPLKHRLDSVIETACFRVAQEALTNVARHANANRVEVELRKESGQLHLLVRDDGVGFAVVPVRKKVMEGDSLGLLNMEERALLVGGNLEFKSAPGQGTLVHAWFPIKPQTGQNESKS